MARALFVGCGCRCREAGMELLERGWQVRGTSRSEGARAAIEAAGIEFALADPDRVGTVVELLGDVTVLVHALGAAGGELHGPRLGSLLEKVVDTPVRGFVYEEVPEGRALVEDASGRWRIPVALFSQGEDGGAIAQAVEDVLRAPG